MGILETIEGTIASVLEGFFRRRIPDAVQPVEIGKALLGTLDRQKRVSVARVYVPNWFKVFLAYEDQDSLMSMEKTLQEELRGVLQDKAERDKLSFIGPVTIEFLEDNSLARGDIRIEAAFVEQIAGENGEFKDIDTRVFSVGVGTGGKVSPSELPEAYLVVEVGQASSQSIRITDGLTVGRAQSCQLRLDEMNVSRVHARFVYSDEGWVVRDNHSTNGIYLNGQSIDSSVLQNDDKLQIGTALLRYKELH